MNRNLIAFLLLIALATGAYFLVIKKPWSTLKADETAFAVKDTASVGKIFIADMQGSKMTLERQKNIWVVNQQYQVRDDYMTVLLATIRNVTVSYPVQHAAMNKVVSELASHNKKVEIYDTHGKLLKAYYVGGPSLNGMGTFMLMEESENPYVTAIPGFQGVLETRYSTDAEAIRSTKIYGYHLNEMKQVKISYREKPDSSFTIEVLGPDSFDLKNAQGISIPPAVLSKEKLHSYLHLFSFINAEAFVNDLSKKDTILQQKPFCTVSVTDRANKEHPTNCYYMPLLKDSPMLYDKKGDPLEYDTDRYFATINNGSDFVIVQRFHFGRLLRNSGYFLKNQKQLHR